MSLEDCFFTKGAIPICVRVDPEVQDLICESLTLPDSLRRTSEPAIEVINNIFLRFS